MTDQELLKFTELLMCSDPWPFSGDDDGEKILKDMANKEAQARGFEDWVAAYHGL